MAENLRELVDTKGLVRQYGLSASFWNSARCTGHGPKYLKMGRRVLYRRADVEEWLSQVRRTSTKQDAGSAAR